MGYTCDANNVISEKEDKTVCEGFIDDSDPCWKDNLREQIVNGSDNVDLQDVLSENTEDDEFDP